MLLRYNRGFNLVELMVAMVAGLLLVAAASALFASILKANRTAMQMIRLNQELTSMHREVVNNLESIQGALLRMNRSIQSEGTFGIMKNNRWYKRIVRKGMEQVRLEIFLVSIGHNLYKYHTKRLRLKKAA